MTGSRMLMLGDAMSILARSTCAPSGNSPAPHALEQVQVLLDRRGSRYGLFSPGSRAACRGTARISSAVRLVRRRPCRARMSCTAHCVELLEVVRGVELAGRPSRSPASGRPRWIASTYSCSSLAGLVSSKRRLHLPPNSCASAEVQADRLGVADVQVAVRLRREARVHPAAEAARAVVLVDDAADEIERPVGLLGGHGGGPPWGAGQVAHYKQLADDRQGNGRPGPPGRRAGRPAGRRTAPGRSCAIRDKGLTQP